jgi:hypothetical protein
VIGLTTPNAIAKSCDVEEFSRFSQGDTPHTAVAWESFAGLSNEPRAGCISSVASVSAAKSEMTSTRHFLNLVAS